MLDIVVGCVQEFGVRFLEMFGISEHRLFFFFLIFGNVERYVQGIGVRFTMDIRLCVRCSGGVGDSVTCSSRVAI